MTSPSVSRGVFIGEISKGERKEVNGKALIEFYLDGFGLRFNAWGDLADKMPPVGSTVLIEGAIKSRNYEFEGKTRQSTEVVVSTIENLDATSPTAAPQPAPAAPVGATLPSGGF